MNISAAAKILNVTAERVTASSVRPGDILIVGVFTDARTGREGIYGVEGLNSRSADERAFVREAIVTEVNRVKIRNSRIPYVEFTTDLGVIAACGPATRWNRVTAAAPAPATPAAAPEKAEESANVEILHPASTDQCDRYVIHLRQLADGTHRLNVRGMTRTRRTGGDPNDEGLLFSAKITSTLTGVMVSLLAENGFKRIGNWVAQRSMARSTTGLWTAFAVRTGA